MTGEEVAYEDIRTGVEHGSEIVLLDADSIASQPAVPDASYSVTDIDIARQLVRSMGVDAIELAERDEYAQGLAALVEANGNGLAIEAPHDSQQMDGRASDQTAMLLGSLDSVRASSTTSRRWPTTASCRHTPERW